MANPINILHLAPFYPPHVGGLESHAAGFDQHMTSPHRAGEKAQLHITTFTPRLPKTAPAKENPSPDLSIYRYPATEIIPNYPLPALWHPEFWRLLSQARANHPNIIISRTRFFLPSLLATILAKVTHTKHLHIEHGSDFVSLSNPITQLIARLYDYTLGSLVLRSANSLVANSKASARFTKQLSGREAKVIYRGIDKDAIAKIKPADLTTNYSLQTTNSVIITFIGRLIDGKGVDDLIHAIKLLTPAQRSPARRAGGLSQVGTNYPAAAGPRPQAVANYKLIIIGSGPQEKQLKELTTKLDLTKHVTFLGEQSSKTTISILKSSDIFVNPSHTEGLPTSVIEAALCKVAIVATNVGGTPEIVTDKSSAILIPPKHPDTLAQKLNDLITNPTLRQKLAANAHQVALPRFTWDHAVHQYHSIFTNLK